jgi:hypothetical protein
MGIQATQEQITEWERKGLIEPLAISGNGLAEAMVMQGYTLGPNAKPITPKPKKSQRTEAKRRLRVEFTIPLWAVSESNAGGKIGAKIRRKAEVKAIVEDSLPAIAWNLESKLVVRMTRYGTKKLDDDNLRGSLKTLRDCLAAWFGRDDGDESIRWAYRQRPGWVASVGVEVREV